MKAAPKAPPLVSREAAVSTGLPNWLRLVRRILAAAPPAQRCLAQANLRTQETANETQGVGQELVCALNGPTEVGSRRYQVEQ